MTLSEQSGILLEAARLELLEPRSIVQWADEVIASQQDPPYWLIELSTLNSQRVIDYVPLLREHSVMGLSMRRRLQIVVLAYEAEQLALGKTLSKLFASVITAERLTKRDGLDLRLRDALVDWDFQNDPSVIEEPLRNRFHDLFREYLADASDVAVVLGWPRRRMLR